MNLSVYGYDEREYTTWVYEEYDASRVWFGL